MGNLIAPPPGAALPHGANVLAPTQPHWPALLPDLACLASSLRVVSLTGTAMQRMPAQLLRLTGLEILDLRGSLLLLLLYACCTSSSIHEASAHEAFPAPYFYTGAHLNGSMGSRDILKPYHGTLPSAPRSPYPTKALHMSGAGSPCVLHS